MARAVGGVISGSHVIVETTDADADHDFVRDVLGFESVDAGDGWLIFALPAAELALHPGDNARHELYLMCDDLDETLAELRRKGAHVSDDVSQQRLGRLGSF